MCFNQCVHIDITDDLLEQAKIDEQNMKRQKGENNPTEILMTKDDHYIGSVAQNIVFRWFDESGIYVEKTKYFDETIHQDRCDFEHRGLNDVKGSPTKGKWNEVYPNTSFLLSNHQLEKVVDWYTFVRVDFEKEVAHIAGVISYQDFMDKSKPLDHENLKHPCRQILAKQLKPFRNYAFGT